MGKNLFRAAKDPEPVFCPSFRRHGLGELLEFELRFLQQLFLGVVGRRRHVTCHTLVLAVRIPRQHQIGIQQRSDITGFLFFLFVQSSYISA